MTCAFALHLLDRPNEVLRSWRPHLRPYGQIALALWATPGPAEVYRAARPAVASATGTDPDAEIHHGLDRLAKSLGMTARIVGTHQAMVSYPSAHALADAVVASPDLAPVRDPLDDAGRERLHQRVRAAAEARPADDGHVTALRALVALLEPGQARP